MKLISALAAAACLALSGCSTLLDSMTTLDETTAGQLAILDEVRVALLGDDGVTLPDQLARTESAVASLAGATGSEGGARSLADLSRDLEDANASIQELGEILDGVRENTESLVWPEGAAPAGEKEGGSIIAGVYSSTSKLYGLLSGVIPSGPNQMLFGGLAVGAFLGIVLGVLLTLLLRRRARD